MQQKTATISLANVPVIETERLILRAPKAEDWAVWHPFHLSERAIYIGGGPEMTTRLSWRGFGHAIGHWVLRGFGQYVMTTKTDDRALGMVGPWFPEGWPEPEVGWHLWSAEAEGKGYAAEAARSTLRHVFDNLGWDTAVSYIDPENARSISLAERLGARLDPQAAQPDTGRDETVLVYRHQKGAA